MTKLIWDQGVRPYEAGVDHAVFYPPNGPGEVWIGLVSVQESPSDTDDSARYFDGTRVRTNRKSGDFAGTIEAFTYPDSFYNLALEPRMPKPFGLTYQTKTESSYHIHLVYNVRLESPSHNYEWDEVTPFTWKFSTKPVTLPRSRPTAHYVIDAELSYPAALQQFEDMLYGTDAVSAHFPTALELFDIFEQNALVRIIDNGDGTWTAIGPDDVISMTDATTFEIDYPSATYVDSDTYQIHSF